VGWWWGLPDERGLMGGPSYEEVRMAAKKKAKKAKKSKAKKKAPAKKKAKKKK
jgi:hypothetical protein